MNNEEQEMRTRGICCKRWVKMRRKEKEERKRVKEIFFQARTKGKIHFFISKTQLIWK